MSSDGPIIVRRYKRTYRVGSYSSYATSDDTFSSLDEAFLAARERLERDTGSFPSVSVRVIEEQVPDV